MFYFQLFTFRFKILRKKIQVSAFRFLFADSDFHASVFQVSTFQVSTDKLQLSRFCFSDSNFQVSADKFQFSRFCFVSFCGNKCLFSNCFHLRNFGTTAPQLVYIRYKHSPIYPNWDVYTNVCIALFFSNIDNK